MRSHLLIDRKDDVPIEIGNEAFEIWASSQPSPSHPGHNEDAAGVWIIDAERIVLAVADGMGGTPAGAESAAIAIQQLDDRLQRESMHTGLRAAVLDAFESANARILEQAPGSGTTLVATEIGQGQIRSYNVGDSIAKLVGQRGRIKLETIPHSPVGYGVAAGLIAPESAFDHDHRHYISNHLGSREMHIEVGSPRRLAARDTLVLASDGLVDNLTSTELVEEIRCGSLEQTARRLIELCDDRMRRNDVELAGKPDDLTFLLARRRVR